MDRYFMAPPSSAMYLALYSKKRRISMLDKLGMLAVTIEVFFIQEKRCA